MKFIDSHWESHQFYEIMFLHTNYPKLIRIFLKTFTTFIRVKGNVWCRDALRQSISSLVYSIRKATELDVSNYSICVGFLGRVPMLWITMSRCFNFQIISVLIVASGSTVHHLFGHYYYILENHTGVSIFPTLWIAAGCFLLVVSIFGILVSSGDSTVLINTVKGNVRCASVQCHYYHFI